MEYKDMYERAFNVLGVKEDAEDAVQSAYLMTIENEKELKLNLEKAISNQRRSKAQDYSKPKRDDNSELLYWYLTENIILEDDIEQIRLDNFKKCFDSLPSRQRKVIILFCLENWSHQQIAIEMKIKEQTSKNLLARARQRLQKVLNE